MVSRLLAVPLTQREAFEFIVAEVRGRSWSCESRPRTDKHPTTDKVLYEAPTRTVL